MRPQAIAKHGIARCARSSVYAISAKHSGESRPIAADAILECLTEGQVLSLTDAEIACIGNDPNYKLKPTVLPATLEKSANYNFAAASADANNLLHTRQTAQITLTLPDDPTLGDSYQIVDGGATGAGTHNINVDPGTKIIAGLKSGIGSIAVTNAGSGLTARPTITISGDGTGATATATMKAVQAAFNAWTEQSGLAQRDVSRILSFSVGPPH
jgi:hypothetical protein